MRHVRRTPGGEGALRPDEQGLLQGSRGPADSSERDIKSAYRKLARQYHPDVNPGNAQAEERFKEIAEAHDVLSDPEKRRRFDQFGSGGPRAGAGPGRGSAVNWADVLRQSQGQQRGGRRRAPEVEPDMSDLLKDLFGRAGAGRAGGGAGRPRVGENLEQELSVSLEDAFRGQCGSFKWRFPMRPALRFVNASNSRSRSGFARA